MSMIIKSGAVDAHGAVRPVAVARPAQPPADDARMVVRRRIAELEAEAKRHREEMETLRAESRQAAGDSLELGRKQGLAEAEKREEERLSALEKNVRAARAELAAAFPALERLAVLVARDCLDLILGESESRSGLLHAVIGDQIRRIERAALLNIFLSPADFPDGMALQSLATALGEPPALFVLDADMPPGGCRMRMRLGEMEVGIAQQWQAVRALLGDLASVEEEA